MAKKKAAKKLFVTFPAMPGIADRVEVITSINNQWCWRMVAHNDETLCCSETYKTLQMCRETACKVADQLRVRLMIQH